MSDQHVGAALRAVRLRRNWRQVEVAVAAGVSQALVSSIERGHAGSLSLETLRRVAGVLDIRLDVVARWRAGELDRLLNARHAALGELVTAYLRELGWEVAPEVSFAINGERGWIDLLAWHAPSRTLLVIELKTELVDVQELIGIVDRKNRLAARIARERGWVPAAVATWVVMAEGSTNRHRVARFGALLRSAFPLEAGSMRAWLRAPSGRVAALTFFSNISRESGRQELAGRQRVRVVKSAGSKRGSATNQGPQARRGTPEAA